MAIYVKKKREEELYVSCDIDILSKEIHESPGCWKLKLESLFL